MQNRSFLRWAGSKQKLIPKLKEYWGEGYERYCEPFMGSAQLFFSIEPENSLLSDTNSELVETFNQIKKDPYPVFKILRKFSVSEKDYYTIRAQSPSSLGINQRCARFIYLNKLCFNGLYRTNLSGQFNVPYAKGNHFNAEEEIEVLRQTSQKLQKSKIVCGDFYSIIAKNLRKGDFIYLDPPYAVGNRRIFKQYGPQTFGLEDLERLRILLDKINKKGAYFLLSYAYCQEALSLFSDWNLVKTYTQRNISGFAEFRRKAAEVLISNISNE